MYDLEIVLPITRKREVYLRRLRDFKKYGLLNIGDRKIALRLLIGTEDAGDVASGWPEGVDVFVAKGDVDQVASKLYKFYVGRNKSEWDTSRWFMRVDDDSVTDVSELITRLDEYDYKDPWYFVTEHHVGNVSLEVDLGVANLP